MFSSELFSFEGRASRSKFWLVFLLSIFVSFVVVLFTILAMPALMLMGYFSPKIAAITSILLYVFMIPMWWISIATSVKRFHDRNKSGWWYLIVLIPILGGLWLIIENGFLSGTAGANNYGSDSVGTPTVTGATAFAAQETIPSYQPTTTFTPSAPTGMAAWKIISLIVGGVLFVAILGRVIWAVQAVKSDVVRETQKTVLQDEMSNVITDIPVSQPQSEQPLTTKVVINDTSTQNIISKFTFVNNPNGVELFAYDIMSPSSRITIKAECPDNIIAKGVKNNGASYYELTQDQSPCSKEIEFIKQNGNGFIQPVSNIGGQQIYVPGTYSDGVDFVKRADDGSKTISFPVRLKVYGKDGNIVESVTNVQVSGSPKVTPRPVVVSTPIKTDAPTATLTVGGVTNLVVNEVGWIEAKWSSTNADNFRQSQTMTGCANSNADEPMNGGLVGFGVSGSLDIQIGIPQTVCTITYTYTAENSKTGQNTTATAIVKVN